MSYITLKIYCPPPTAELLIAELAELGVNAFLEQENGLEASVEKEAHLEEEIRQILSEYQVDYEMLEVAKQNWNQLWESNYPAVEINEECIVRAPFHTLERSYRYELVISPKMSFGTGHHDTTMLMMRAQLALAAAHRNANVLDVGCGTGILGILAKKLGATSVYACDIEEWAVENTRENAQLNQVEIDVQWGTMQFFFPALPAFEIILANINRNVLVEDIPHYEKRLKKNGYLFVSGFYWKDQAAIEQKASQVGFLKVAANAATDSPESWMCMVFQKL